MGTLPDFDSPTLQNLDASHLEPGRRVSGTNRQYVRFYWLNAPEVYAAEVNINEKTGEVQVKKTAVRNIKKLMIHVKTPGDKNEYDGEATAYHKMEFARQYTAFMEGRTAPLGRAIDECTYVSPVVAVDLKYLGVHTEEQLADASDLLCDRIPNGWELREFSRANVKARMAESNPKVLELMDQLDAMKETLKNAGLLNAEGLPIQKKEVETADTPVEQIKEVTSAEVRRSPKRPQ